MKNRLTSLDRHRYLELVRAMESPIQYSQLSQLAGYLIPLPKLALDSCDDPVKYGSFSWRGNGGRLRNPDCEVIIRLTSYLNSGQTNGLPHSTGGIVLESHWCANSFGFSRFPNVM